jgi:2-dehydro-3-deoxyglucarate aldolase/4-hydroxy-2-oxoheptanedioate aldolase
MKENKVKRILREGGTVLGTMIVEFTSPETARMLAAAGFDYIFIDTEHGAFNHESVTDLIRAGRSMDLTCIVRVPDNAYHLIARTLDLGAHGIMVPRTETREQVENIIQAAKYPPWGVRGCGIRPIITDYELSSIPDQIEHLNKDTIVITQIESGLAVDSIDDLLSVEGVDVALIGPNDLSISLGVPGEHMHPTMIEAIQKVVDACAKRGIASGIHVRDMSVLQFWMERGMKFITCDTDVGLLISAAMQAVTTLRDSVKE